MSQTQEKFSPPILNDDVIVFMTTFLYLTLLLTFNVFENHIYYFFQIFIKSLILFIK